MLSYPRLSRSLTMLEVPLIRERAQSGGLEAVAGLARVHHERQQPVATGRVATSDEIRAARTKVMEALNPWTTRGLVDDKSTFDRALGAALHSALQILPSDAAHEETWNFLSAVVFPDVIALRFLEVPDDRVVGGQRNVLRKTWIRQEILGEEITNLALKEDELVGLFERTALVRNRRLALLVARTVAQQTRPKRDKWARKLYKLIVFQMGVRLLDALDDDALEELVKSCAESADSLTLRESDQGKSDD